jgi:histidyl-tRNA synthetase
MVQKINDFFRATAMKNNPYYERAFGKNSELESLKSGLANLSITNVTFDQTLMRGFDYYTGTIFEIFDTASENNRSLIGGGRYDNLTEMFGGDPISGIGFGMGDVTMRDFLETHNLLEGKVQPTAPTLVIIPEDTSLNMEGQKVAQEFRNAGIRVSVDISDRKSDKKKATAEKAGAKYILVLDTNTIDTYTVKELATRKETTGTLTELAKHIS